MALLYTILIILFAIAGSFLSAYISKTKSIGNHLVCPFGHNCDSVVRGRFSTFFGVDVEKIGLLYYTGVAIFYALSLIFPISQEIVFVVLLITGLSFAFSFYLLATQLFILKKWCTLCLGSTAVSFMILVLSFLGFESSFGAYLFEYHDVLNWVFVLSVFVGVISSSMHAKKLIVFLRDFKISKKESNRLAMFSHVGWTAIAITFLSGLGLVLTDIYGNITEGSEFIVMAIILGVLIAYEVIINMIISPKLVDIHFGDDKELDNHKHMMMRKTAFAFVAVGVVSWYLLLLFTTVSFYEYSSAFLIIMYVVVLLVGVGVSLFVENTFYRKSLLISDVDVKLEE